MQKRFTPDAGGVFPEWEEKTLGECMTLIASKGYKGKDLVNDESKAIMFSPSDIDTSGVVSLVKNAHISDELFKKSKEALVKNGDILFTKTASIGKVGYVKNLYHNATINPQIVILRANENVDSYFLFCAVRTESFKKQVRKISGGTTIKTMSQEALKELKIKIPKSIEEQRKIAAALAAYDEMIALKTVKLETWQECKKTMVKEIFGRTKRFKDDDGREFPEWEEKTLGDVCVRVTKRNKGCKSNLPLTISAKDGIVDQKTYFNKIVASKNLENYYIIEKGEFAYNKSYSAGFKYGSIKRLDNYEDGVLSPIYICFSISDTNIVDSDYLVQYFDSMKWNDQMSVLCNEGVRNHGAINVKTEDFFAIRIPLPCMEEQQKIGSFLAEIDKEIQIQKEFVKTYAEGKKRMMRELME